MYIHVRGMGVGCQWVGNYKVYCWTQFIMHILCLKAGYNPVCRALLLCSYVSDYGDEGYKSVCQERLLRSGPDKIPRTCPPSALEWRAARLSSPMALPVVYLDGELRAPLQFRWADFIWSHSLYHPLQGTGL